MMKEFTLTVLNMSISGAIVILTILLARLILKKAPKKWSYLLWGAAAFRLCCPVSIKSAISLFNFVPKAANTAENAVSAAGRLEYIPSIVRSTQAPISVNTPLPNITPMPQITPHAIQTSVPAAVHEATSAPAATQGVIAGLTENIGGSGGVGSAAQAASSVGLVKVLMTAAVVLWIVGMIALIAYSVIGYIKMYRKMSTAVLLEGNIYQSELVRSPFILGVLRPKIYIPYGLSEEARRYVLAHERYHIKRGDHIIKVFSFLLLALHWFNPLCWLAFFLSNKDMEMSCDEKVLGDKLDIRRQYSTTLLSFAVGKQFPSASPLAFGESGVRSRIKNAMNYKKPKFIVTVIALVLSLAVIAACVVNPNDNSATTDPQEANSSAEPTDAPITKAPATDIPATDPPATAMPGYPPRIVPRVSSIVSRNGHTKTAYALADDGRLFAFDPWDDEPSVGSPILFEVESVYTAATKLENEQNYAFALKTDGTLWAWGDNEYGQLGTGDTSPVSEPVKIMDGVDKVYHFCTQYALDSVFALKKDGSLWGWGRNETGELGDGTDQIQLDPVKILDGVSEMFPYNKEWPAGLNFNVHALKTDGTLWAWGSSQFSGEDYAEGESAAPMQILDKVVSVHATDSNSYAIRSDNSLWVWGYGGDYSGSAGDSEKPKMPFKVMDNVKTVVTRDDEAPCTAYAIDLDGVLWDISMPRYWIGGMEQPNAPKRIMDGVVSAITYDRATFALREDGTLWSWGTKGMTAAEGETYGFGNGTAEGSSEPVQILDGVASFDVRMMMDRGKYEWHYWIFGSAIKTDGSLYVWGYNEDNELGLGTNENVLAPVKLADNVREAHIGSYMHCYITVSGDLYCWENYYPLVSERQGQITPLKVLENVEYTDGANVFITKDGALWYRYLDYAPVYVIGEK